MPSFIIKRNPKCLLNISENKSVNFSPSMLSNPVTYRLTLFRLKTPANKVDKIKEIIFVLLRLRKNF
jgi:hypothetical protein